MNHPPPTGVDRLVVLGEYEGDRRKAILWLKRGRGTSELRSLASQLAEEISRSCQGDEVVTWVPTTSARRRRRGFDQSRLLARVVARRSGLPCRDLLRRRSRAQQGLSSVDRRLGPVFSARNAPAAVVLVDDVMTTGGSLSSAALALRARGARQVTAAVIAQVPPRERVAG